MNRLLVNTLRNVNQQSNLLPSGQLSQQSNLLSSGQLSQQSNLLSSGQLSQQSNLLSSGQLSQQSNLLSSGQLSQQSNLLSPGQLRHMSTKPNNILLTCDAYKLDQNAQYVPNCTKVYSYMLARSNKTFDKTVFFGLQYYLQKYLTQPITKQNVKEFLSVRKNIFGQEPPKGMVEKFDKLAELNYWPIHIKAVPEGSVVGVKNVLMTITNTLPEFYWTVGFLETLLLKTWYPITVATTSYEYKKVVDKYFDETVDNELYNLKQFMVHDFGYRGDTSEESAVLSGMAHLTSFTGSDTICAYRGIMDHYTNIYNKNRTNFMGCVPASEHSVMCSYGRENELDAFKHMLKIYPEGIVSIVSDTYNIWNVMTNFAKELKPDILSRNGKIVFRPDSGNPEYIICGDPEVQKTHPNSPVAKGCIRLLDEMFGSTINSKGYKELNPKVGLIYGDGMYLERYKTVLERLKTMGYAASNLVIGVGGILRYHSRDTMGFALKATKVEVDGVEKSIMKDPITDSGKKSHKGYLYLNYDNDKREYYTLDDVTKEMETEGILETVYKDGLVYSNEDLNLIRTRIMYDDSLYL
jgi:nicotinamide phosphoribosyltransferase